MTREHDIFTRERGGERAAPEASAEKTAPAAKAASVDMSKDEADALDRDMRTKRPEDVVLPGGETLAQVNARRDALHAEEGRDASKARDLAFARETSGKEPSTTRVTVTAGGDVVSSPVGLPEAPAEKPE